MNCNGNRLRGINKRSVTMENKSIVTYAGDNKLFGTIEKKLVQAIPADTSDWQRSFSRPLKKVKLCPSFVAFTNDVLPTEKNWNFLKQPILHTYWTECSDVDMYKTTVRDDIDGWLKILHQHNIQDWMIVLVETYDIKKSNKLLPRTTVLDKIRSDFAAKSGDRCLSVINPIKSESRSAESWRGLINRIRHLMLSAYDKSLSRFVDIIREQRERRNQHGWNFCRYFLLQEELAFALEMLGLYDEALVQYDELDALFTQFVLNSNVAETPAWLTVFQSPLNNWAGVNLNNNVDQRLRELLAESKASLLDLRSYLFSRQSAMLLLLNTPWEVAQRCLSFVYNTLSELKILEVQRPEGAVECWAFLCALEVLQACQLSAAKTNNGQQLDLCSLHTAGLWALATHKLGELGKLCGLMPGSEPSSEQLHTVVYLIAGMGDSEMQSEGKLTPTDKLKGALSSKEMFKRQYLEHAELAMGTYKHVGRIRSARFIGKELARFYGDLGENQKAVVFLTDALKTYLDEGWDELATQTRLELAQCYKRMDDVERYTKICSALASSEVLHATVRNTYYEEMLAYMKMLSLPRPLLTTLQHTFTILSLEVNVMDKVIQDCVVSIDVSIKSLLPRTIRCTRAAISTEEIPRPAQTNKRRGVKPPAESSVNLISKCTFDDIKSVDRSLMQLPAFSYFDYNEDKSLASVGTVIKNQKPIVRRSDSAKHRKSSVFTEGDFSNALTCNNFDLNPGINNFTVSQHVDQPGLYKIGQLSLVVEEKLEFLSGILNPRLCYEVVKTQPTIAVNSRDLLAGLVQSVELVISSGSVNITNDARVKVWPSRGLSLLTDEDRSVTELEIKLSACEPFDVTTARFKVLAELPPKKDASSMEHKLNVQCPWGAEENLSLHFGPPFMSGMHLHTAKRRKFLQIVVTGLTSQLIQLSEPELTTSTLVEVAFKDLNPKAGQRLVVGNGLQVFFMWELDIGKDEKILPTIKTDFRVKYCPIESTEDVGVADENDDPLHIARLARLEKLTRTYRCNFDITDYVTMFTVSSKVEASGPGGEFCRAGSMCHLHLTVTRMIPCPNPSLPPQLMYEVLADQSMWAVCGRTAGIISLETLEKQSVTLDVMPLTSGYLPLPVVRLSRYVPAVECKSDLYRNNDVASGPRLEPFSPGQVYNASKAQQVHVLPTAPTESN
ncbi:trafficking protein particle complex subunit 10 [Venturia canescens]|uniref:trafficking protein particle complex subunit 10 n=1 Tax=Venturia canescens TaxID=32260 RepID=UPI001C9D0D39|nr:trafficking protein particle complex subunit 10 [Venturia canescens]